MESAQPAGAVLAHELELEPFGLTFALQLGDQFDLKGFHRAVLSNGAVPLALLGTVVDQYIAETQAAP